MDFHILDTLRICLHTLLILSPVPLFSQSSEVQEVNTQHFFKEGDVYLSAILPVYYRDRDTGKCTILNNVALWLTFAFVDVLRQHDFTVRARAPDGSERRLRVGYVLANQCGGVPPAVDFTLRFQSLSVDHNYCSSPNPASSPLAGVPRPLKTMAVVGPLGSEDNLATAPLNANRGMVQLSTFVSGTQFSCVLPKGKSCGPGSDYEYLFRFASTDPFAANAMLDILLHFGWSHFALVAANTLSSIEIMFDVLAMLSSYERYKDGLCMAFQAIMDPNEDGALNIYRQLKRNPLAKVVVLLAESDEIELLMKTIVKKAKEENTTVARIWVGYYLWGRAEDFMYSNPEFNKVMQSMLLVRLGEYGPFAQYVRKIKEKYAEYVLGLNASVMRKGPKSAYTPLMCRYIELHNDCEGVCEPSSQTSHKRCPDGTVISNQYISNSLVDMIEGTTVLASEVAFQAVQILFEQFVESGEANGEQDKMANDFYDFAYKKMRATIKNMRLPCKKGMCSLFPGNFQSLNEQLGIYSASVTRNKVVRVGYWELWLGDTWEENYGNITIEEVNDIVFGPDLFDSDMQGTRNRVPLSHCSPVCKNGEEPFWDPSKPTCCHFCRVCGNTEISDGSSCQPCQEGTKPSANLTECVLLPIADALSHTTRVPLLAACSVLLAILIASASLHLRCWRSNVVRASDRTLT